MIPEISRPILYVSCIAPTHRACTVWQQLLVMTDFSQATLNGTLHRHWAELSSNNYFTKDRPKQKPRTIILIRPLPQHLRRCSGEPYPATMRQLVCLTASDDDPRHTFINPLNVRYLRCNNLQSPHQSINSKRNNHCIT